MADSLTCRHLVWLWLEFDILIRVHPRVKIIGLSVLTAPVHWVALGDHLILVPECQFVCTVRVTTGAIF